MRPRVTAATAVAVGGVAALGWLTSDGYDRPDEPRSIVVGVPAPETAAPAEGPTIVTPPPPSPAAAVGPGPAASLPELPEADTDPSRPAVPEPPARGGLAPPGGQPWRPAIPLTSSIAVPDGLQFVLVIGSDSRPGTPVARGNADSIHLLAVNPATGQGTVLGIPRDAWVEIPGRGQGKVGSALAKGGPDLLATTVRRLTGLPVQHYVLTGFDGLVRMVDEIGGIDVELSRRMDDPYSGARFDRGWHRLDGTQALAYSRNRKDVAHGDFTRSEHQGNLILSALAKVRAEVGDDPGLLGWVRVLVRHVELDVPAGDVPRLAALGRRLDPSRLVNAVAPGRVGNVGSQSVVILGREAAALFEDLRPDAVVGAPAVGSPGVGGAGVQSPPAPVRPAVPAPAAPTPPTTAPVTTSAPETPPVPTTPVTTPPVPTTPVTRPPVTTPPTTAPAATPPTGRPPPSSDTGDPRGPSTTPPATDGAPQE